MRKEKLKFNCGKLNIESENPGKNTIIILSLLLMAIIVLAFILG